MDNFRPFEPHGNSAQNDWIRSIHRAAFDERRILTTPDTLTTQTTQGVFHRPKPMIEESIADTEPTEPPSNIGDYFYFLLNYRIKPTVTTRSVGGGNKVWVVSADISVFGEFGVKSAASTLHYQKGISVAGLGITGDFTNSSMLEFTRVIPIDWTGLVFVRQSEFTSVDGPAFFRMAYREADSGGTYRDLSESGLLRSENPSDWGKYATNSGFNICHIHLRGNEESVFPGAENYATMYPADFSLTVKGIFFKSLYGEPTSAWTF